MQFPNWNQTHRRVETGFGQVLTQAQERPTHLKRLHLSEKLRSTPPIAAGLGGGVTEQAARLKLLVRSLQNVC